jgi:hypothetical protein
MIKHAVLVFGSLDRAAIMGSIAMKYVSQVGTLMRHLPETRAHNQGTCAAAYHAAALREVCSCGAACFAALITRAPIIAIAILYALEKVLERY